MTAGESRVDDRLRARLTGAKILITQAHLVQYAGSEVVTLELAEFFAEHGAQVVIATYAFADPFASNFDGLSNVTLFEFDSEELAANLAERRPDIAWIQHSIIPRPLLERPDGVTFVFHHMSSILPAEYTLDAAVEVALASAVVFESPRSRELHLETEVYAALDQDRLQVLGNPAPGAFASMRRPEAPERRLVVVSNHIPIEMQDALTALEETFQVERIGAQLELGARPQRVTAEVLSRAGAIVSIGKTVQYSVAAGIPVYLYDHFGGVGWLTRENFDGARHHNFSGRHSRQLAAAEIVDEIANGFDAAQAEAAELRADRLADVSLPDRILGLLDWIAANPRESLSLTGAAVNQHDTIQRAFAGYVRELVRRQRDAETLAILRDGDRVALAQAHRTLAALRTRPIRTLLSALARHLRRG
ncbi:MAG TPA: hypothetical protein VK139_08020 [Microbacteriaceae bacterium]|nr:hypothetical protein [Microbacteriaceae bacterium]